MNQQAAHFPTKPFASCFALAAFAIAIIAGLHAGREASSILITALAALFVCQILGAIAAAVIETAIREHLKAYRLAHPVPDLDPHANKAAQPTQTEQTE